MNRSTGEFSVRVAGPTVWNNLPVDIINVPLFHGLKKNGCVLSLCA